MAEVIYDSSNRAVDRQQSINLPQVQVFRAIAAVLVLLGHIQSHAIITAGSTSAIAQQSRVPAGFGVDLFFAISGFIMVVSSMRLFGRQGAPSVFLVRRAIRLIPLYWIATLAFLPVVLFGSQSQSTDAWASLFSSLAFFPHHASGSGGLVAYPLLSLGWTLNYEAAFYALFSIAILLPMSRSVIVLTAALIGLVVLGEFIQPERTALYFWTRPIILEFGFGAIIAWLWARNIRLSIFWSASLIVIAIVCVIVDPMGLRSAPAGTSTPNDFERLIGWGIPAAVVLAAGALAENNDLFSRPAMAPLVTLGDWSYALYLTHPFALIVVIKLWKLMEFQHSFGPLMLALLQAAFAVAVAGFTYRWFERPVTAWLRRRFA